MWPAILAPLLGPRTYGVFSVAMVFVGLSEYVLGEAIARCWSRSWITTSALSR
jgi:hypothetical protein